MARSAARLLLAVGMVVSWLAAPLAEAERGTGAIQCDVKKCETDPSDGDCSGRAVDACELTAHAQIDCHAATPPCPAYVAQCQTLTASDGCWLGQLISPAAPPVEVDPRDFYKTRLHPGKYYWVMGQNPDPTATSADYTLCVYAPGQPPVPATPDPLFPDFDSVTIDVPPTGPEQTWGAIVKLGPGCPTAGEPAAEGADRAPGDGGTSWWPAFGAPTAAACDGLCQTVVGERKGAYCFGYAVIG